jgi:hypothetical protein
VMTLLSARAEVDSGMMLLLSQASDDIVKSTLVMALPSRCWSWRDVIAESC